MWDGHDGMGWWMIWGALLWLALIFAVGFLAARLAGGTGKAEPPPREPETGRDSPIEIARRRYAAGEITREEFEQLRRDLT